MRKKMDISNDNGEKFSGFGGLEREIRCESTDTQRCLLVSRVNRATSGGGRVGVSGEEACSNGEGNCCRCIGLKIFAKAKKVTNKHEFTARAQYGGTETVCLDQLAHRTGGTGADERGLGRWSWILFRGKHNLNTRIVTAYQPNATMYTKCLGSVYKQQE